VECVQKFFVAFILTPIFSPIFLFLTENVDKGVICQLELDEAKVKQFKDAIENNYWLEFFVGMF
jgi:transmembrane 9 superfamily protein 3